MGFSTHLRCDQLVEIASDYLERALSAHDAEQLEQHLVICGACAEYIAQLRAIREASLRMGQAREAESNVGPEHALESLLDRFRGGGRP